MQAIIIGALVLVAAISGALFFTPAPKQAEAPAPQATSEVTSGTPPTATTSEMVASAYKDGVYKAVGAYRSPAGEESVDVSITLAGGVITAAEFTGNATNPGSVKNQGKFKDGYQALVVGKSIDAVKLDVVNGSSLTPKGFMDALAKVKTEALTN